MTSTKQIITVIIGSVALIGLLAWWGSTHPQNELLLESTDENFQAPLSPEELERVNPANVNTMNPIAVIETTKGTIELELFRDEMPVTAGNFITLAEGGFYDGTKFHRVIENFMIQGGDPNSKTDNEATWGTGGPGYAIADEHIAGEKLTNVRGTIAMANSGPNTGGSQFFINLVDNTYLDFDKEPLTSKHPVFGRVVAGMDVVDAIGMVDTKPGDRPVEPIVVNSITIREAVAE